MSGTLNVRPIEANLVSDKDIFGKMDPYCIVHLGQYSLKGQVCKSGGRHPQWGDTITVQRNFDKVLLIELKDKDRFSKDDSIGVCHIDLSSLPSQTPVRQWYPLSRWHSNAGEILIELTFTPSMSNQQYGGQLGGMVQSPFQVSPYLGSHIASTLAPATGYQQPCYAPSSYQQQQPVYQQQPLIQQQPTYQPQQPVYQQQQPMYQPQQPVYQQQQPVYQQQPMMQPGYQQQPMMQPGYQQQQPVYQQQPMMQPGYQQVGMQQQPLVQQQPFGQQPGFMQPRPY